MQNLLKEGNMNFMPISKFRCSQTGKLYPITCTYSFVVWYFFLAIIRFYSGLLWFNNISLQIHVIRLPTVYPKKYARGLCFAVLCCGYTLTDFPISIRLTSLALWQSNDCPSASKATLMNMDKYFMWIHYERLRNHNKAKHNKTVCIFLGIYCIFFSIASMALGQSYMITAVLVKYAWQVWVKSNQQPNHNETQQNIYSALNS